MQTITYWKSIIEKWKEYEQYPCIYSFILYSPLDRNMINFFSDQNCWNYLDGISTSKCLNFIIAETRPGFSSWSESTQEEDLPLSEFHEIQDAFDVDEDQIPCLIFFSDIKNRLKTRLICKIDRDANLEELRKIFDKIYKLLPRIDFIHDQNDRRKVKQKIFKKFKRVYKGKKALNRVLGGVKKAGKWAGKTTIEAVVKETLSRGQLTKLQ